MKRNFFALLTAAACGTAWADEPKPAVLIVPAQQVEAKKADDKKTDDKKKKELTEEEQAELEYKKYLEEQAKQLAEVAKKASHLQSGEVKVKAESSRGTLQTLVLADDNRILALVAQPRGFNSAGKKTVSEIHAYDFDGKKLNDWTVDFHAHAIGAAPDGTVYVAGDGRVASYDKDGKVIGKPAELPHIADMFKDMDALRKKAEEELKKQQEQMKASLKAARKQFEDRIKKIEEVKEEERTKAQQRQLEQAKSILKSYDEMEKQDRGMSVDQYINSMTARARTINAVAVSDTDVYIACGETEGWGYAVWRFTRDLTEPKKILSDLGGCCGQMDVKTHGGNLVVALNTKKQFGIYNRDGESLGTHGLTGGNSFGGCCNPMNTCTNGSSGDIFTAESEGIVRRFSPKGDFIGVVGTVKISGGCKNVAIGATSNGEKIVFCDQPGSRFLILSKKDDAKSEDSQR